MDRYRRLSLFVAVLLSAPVTPSRAAAPTGKVTANWDKVTRVSQTVPTLQVVVNPPLRRGTPVHDNAFNALRDLGADYVRYVPWLPYPKLGVAALEPPKDGKTSWDFSLIDPITIDFLEATKGHPVVLNFSTIPAWMHKTDKPVEYPADPDQPTWKYTQRTEPRDPTFKQIADYYARLLAWYTQGGFTDELGKRHESGHHYAISHWEVLNEPDLEYPASPETYTRLYDAVVEAMRKVQPGIKFVGASLAFPRPNPEFFEYFLDKRNHQPGIPIDYISYHFYAVPDPDESAEVQEHTFFTQAESFVNAARYIETMRKRLSPGTKTMVNEVGAISADDLTQGEPGYVFKPIPNSYWNLASATYAYLFGELSRIGIDVVGESQLVGYPTQFPSVSMVDWNDGRPNARYWTLKLLKDNFGPGDKLVETQIDHRYVYALGAVKSDGKRRLLLVNKRNRPFEVSVPGATGGQLDRVDQTTALQPPASSKLSGEKVSLGGFAVAVVTLPQGSPQAAAPPYSPRQSDRPVAVAGDEPGFQPIFDGKTLAGWEGDRTYWRVEDGSLVGQITPATVVKSNTFLIWRDGRPRDFELKLDYRITPDGNSGINYRSMVVPDPVTPGNAFAMRGYQCDIDGRNQYVGNNYEEKGRLFLAVRGQLTRVVGGRPPVLVSTLGEAKELAAVVSDGWNSVHLMARGPVLTHIINGRVMSLVIDDDSGHRPLDGLIGVQVHVGPPMKVEYRNLRLKHW